MEIINLAKQLIPRSLNLPIRYAYKWLAGQLDFELAVLKNERPNCFRAIDIGTNIGIYSYGLSRSCKKVESFEPVPQCTEMLRAYAKAHGNITVHNVGLSNHVANVNLYAPLIYKTDIPNVGLASLNDPGGAREVIPITVKRLDDYKFEDVSIIKIDVEGHEFEVLQGAAETILREKPILLVEIEQRHLRNRTIEDVFTLILSFGYTGGYYFNRRFFPLSSFLYKAHQEPFLDSLPSRNYINNFIFRPIDFSS